MLCPSQNRVVTNASHSLMIALIAAVIACLTCAPLLAQVTSGTIFGTVTDPTGAVVKDATVTITNPANGLTRTVVTSSDGDFVAPNLLPGTYNIVVEAKGFKKLQTTGITLSAADKLSAGDFVLAVGTTSDEVTVTADAGQVQLQSNSGERSDLISGKQLNDVAINGRNVLDYMKLIPGVSGTFSGSVSGTGGIDGFNVNGTRANQHEFTLDGASNVDTGNNGGTHVTINPDAIQEVKVLTSNYQAEFGKAAGGQVAIVSKGGTNQWHGDVRFFHRHEGLNANEYFNKTNELQGGNPNTPALYRYNDVGYQIGGPIKRDKVFVFWSQEFYRQLIPVGGNTQFYTPTDLERKGDFSQSTDGNGVPVVITGPGITNNVITAGINADIQKILSLYPEPNVPGFGVGGQNYNYATSFSGNQPRREDILRVDYQINGKNRLYGRWIHNSETDSMPFLSQWPGPYGVGACTATINFPGGCTQKHPGWNFSANLVSTITPTVLNEFSVGPSHTLSLVDGANGNVSRGKNGISLPLLYPVGSNQSIPDMSFGGLENVNFQGGYLGGTPWSQANTTINVNDNLSWVRHSHTLKAGMFYQRSRKDQPAWNNINGQINFNPTVADGYNLGDPLASALLGYFSSFDQSTARPFGKFRYNQLEFYVQDTWKITSRLTLDYGMRFAWIPPQYDANNQVALFNPSAYNPANAVTVTPGGNIDPTMGGDPLNGMQFTRSGQLPDGGWNSHGIMPEPRLGFAYDLFGDHKTILRGGAGMMHDRTQGNLIFNTVFNNPALVQTASVPANNVANLPTLAGSFGNGVLSNILAADRSGKVPTVYSFSLGVQHEIAKGTTLDLAYVGTLSRHLVTTRDLNALPYGTAFTKAAQDPNCTDGNGNFVFPGGVVPDQQPGLQPQYIAAGLNFNGFCAYGWNGYNDNYLEPYKGYFKNLSYLKFDGTSNYNSLQVSLQRRFSKGLTFGAVYTWSKSLTTANTDGDTQDPFNPLLDYRAASWDRTHVFAANYVYDLPGLSKHFGGPKWLSYLTDHYQLSGVTQFMTGTPIDSNNNGSFPSGYLNGSNQWSAVNFNYTFDRSGNVVFPAIGPPTRGTRDILRSGGLQNWDMSLFKNIPLGSNEARYLQLRLEAFNAFNHPNFNNKNYGVSTDGPWPWFGDPSRPLSMTKNSNWGTNSDTYNASGGPGSFRVVQLAAKLYF
ncbi:MAG: carboxypeptidase regulatory-like domain-containing protein [Acidobacteriia bacterium]|nr:carboxypeptidase regulatory-like domain-containing protein [Terriglobia bacterium]